MEYSSYDITTANLNTRYFESKQCITFGATTFWLLLDEELKLHIDGPEVADGCGTKVFRATRIEVDGKTVEGDFVLVSFFHWLH